MKEITGILIDPFTQKACEIAVEAGNIQDIYMLGRFDCFDIVHLPNGDSLYIDDEGLFEGKHLDEDGFKRGFFLVDKNYKEGYGPTLIGRGIILGCNHRTGNACNSKTRLRDVKVAFFKAEGGI